MLLGLSVKIRQKARTSSPPQGLTLTVLSQKPWSHVSRQRWCEWGVQATRYMVILFMMQGHTISWCRVMVIPFHNTGSQSQYFMVYGHGHTISFHMVQGHSHTITSSWSHYFITQGYGHIISWYRVMVTLFHNTGLQSQYFMVQGHSHTISLSRVTVIFHGTGT